MLDTKNDVDQQALIYEATAKPFSRRKFFGIVGGATAIMATAAACKKDDNNNNNGGVDLGSGDTGILNYAYALEQLEAAFYSQVVMTPYSGISTLEMEYMTDIRNHEVAHREFFKAALGSNAIIGLEVDFSSINFSSRDNVLATAKAFEDLGVTAYNGAGQLISATADGATYLTLAGKIVSVEARHAALIADLISNGTFANTVDGMGLDSARTPSEVLSIAGAYIKTKINASNLPS
ncbi:MAG: ferritin-like domain-containing protein [Ginsengibacter sp.]